MRRDRGKEADGRRTRVDDGWRNDGFSGWTEMQLQDGELQRARYSKWADWPISVLWIPITSMTSTSSSATPFHLRPPTPLTLQSVTPTGHGIVASSSIAAGRETYDYLIGYTSPNRTITLPPRHSHRSIPYLQSPKCTAIRASAGGIPITKAEEIL